jgi:hypothetical protein
MGEGVEIAPCARSQDPKDAIHDTAVVHPWDTARLFRSIGLMDTLSLPQTQTSRLAPANRLIVCSMRDAYGLIWWVVIGLFRSRAALEAEILVLRHQLNILRRRSYLSPT